MELFTTCATQWRVPPMGGVPMGIDYNALIALMPLFGGPSRDLLERVRLMEATVLTEMHQDRSADRG